MNYICDFEIDDVNYMLMGQRDAKKKLKEIDLSKLSDRELQELQTKILIDICTRIGRHIDII